MTDRWIAADWPAPGNVVAGTTLRDGELNDVNLPGEPCWLEQVHGTNVVVAEAYESPPAADGSVSHSTANVCVIRTADCLPVLLCEAEGFVVAAAHAGWRGLAAGVIENTVERMGVDPTSILAWLGPAISQESFEVGEEVKDEFIAQHSSAAACFAPNERGRWQGDLYALARLRLAETGISRVYGGGLCTYLDEQRFHSHRRDPDCGRLVSFVALGYP
jgi:YfiH family protein